MDVELKVVEKLVVKLTKFKKKSFKNKYFCIAVDALLNYPCSSLEMLPPGLFLKLATSLRVLLNTDAINIANYSIIKQKSTFFLKIMAFVFQSYQRMAFSKEPAAVEFQAIVLKRIPEYLCSEKSLGEEVELRMAGALALMWVQIGSQVYSLPSTQVIRLFKKYMKILSTIFNSRKRNLLLPYRK